MKRTIIYCCVIMIVLISSCKVNVYARATEADSSDRISGGHDSSDRPGGGHNFSGVSAENEETADYFSDYLNSLFFTTVGAYGLITGDLDTVFEAYVYDSHGLTINDFLEQYLPDNFYNSGTDSFNISSDLYELLDEFKDYLVENDYAESVEPTDYYKYYTENLSGTRYPEADNAYNYFMSLTGDEGKELMDSVMKRKYYWIGFGGSFTMPGTGGAVNGLKLAYIDAEYENSVIFIKGLGSFMIPYVYDSTYGTFTEVPVHIVTYEYDRDGSRTLFSNTLYASLGITSNETLERYVFYEGDVYFNSSMLSGSTKKQDFITSSTVQYWIAGTSVKDNYYNESAVDNAYYGKSSFVVWETQNSYLEWNTMYPDYNPNQQVIYNEDNSVTITNIYNTTNNYGDDSETVDYSDILNDILVYLKEIDEKMITETESYGDILSDILEAVRGIDVNSAIEVDVPDYSSILGDIHDQLKKLNNKMTYNNIIDTLDLVDDWLSEVLEFADDETTATAKAAFQSSLETKFPFSIVSDFMELVLIFSAEPIEPIFDIPFKIPALGINETVTIDLTRFEDAVRVFHWFWIVLWLWGLMRLTMQIFDIGGGDSV